MIFGGIPYYLNYFRKELSLAQNVDLLLYSEKAVLREEYGKLFSSIFNKPEEMKKIVEWLSSRHSGFTRTEISQNTGIEEGGALSKMLNALVASDFVLRYVPFGKSKRNEHYKLIDPFCLFYLRFVKSQDALNADFWTLNLPSQSIISWRGIAFEEVCLRHIRQIKQALGIVGVASKQSAWTVKGDDESVGSQVDLLIERKDNVTNMCEMKFYGEKFTVTKAYERILAHRINLLSEHLPQRSVIHSTLITTYGLTYNEYSGSFQRVVTLDDLFQV